MKFLKFHLPGSDSVLPVYAVISFLVYSWTMVIFLWKLPSWLKFLTVGEIFINMAYIMTACLMESMIVLGLLLAICALLPASFMKDVFITRGTLAALFGLTSIMFYMYRFSEVGYSLLDDLIPWSIGGLALTLFLTFFAARFRLVARLAAWISDRLLVFLYFFLPISFLSLIVVLYRNIL